MNPEDLEKAINILYNPHQANQETIRQATEYCDQFLNQNADKLREFFLYFTQTPNIHTQFWFLQSIAKIIKEKYHVIYTDMEMRKQIHKAYFEILTTKYDIIFHNKQNTNKYALIFVYLLAQDFPHNWETPFEELIGYLKQSSSDVSLLKNFINFLVRIMITFEEEFVEKVEQKDHRTQQMCTRLKDGIRKYAIVPILGVFYETLQNVNQFNEEFINDLIDCISMLIDWNLIEHFHQSMIPLILQFLLKPEYKTSALRCIYALVDKGMDDHLRLDLVYNIKFTEIVKEFPIAYKDRDMDGDWEEQDKEEEFQQILSEAIEKLGEWCIEINNPQLETLPNQSQKEQFYELYRFLIEVSILRLDTDKPKIGRPLMEFLTNYIQSIKRTPQLDNMQQTILVEIINVIARRLKYPKWFTFQKDENENEEDFILYRDELQNLFQNLTMVQPFLVTLLGQIHQLFMTINPQTTSVFEAEVPLLLVFNLQKTMPNSTNSNYEQIIVYYKQLFQDMISINFFSYNHRIINLVLLENLIRYSYYLTKMGVDDANYVQTFFGPYGIYHSDPTVVSRSIYLFYRFCEKSPDFLQNKANEILAKCEEFINKNEQIAAQGGETHLTLDDFLSIFGIVGSLLSFKGIDKQLRNQKLRQAVDSIKERLNSCSPGDKDKICWYIKYISCLTKGFTHEIQEIKDILQEIVNLLVQILYQNFGHVAMCEQILHYLQQLTKLIGSDILPVIKDVTIEYFKNVQQFERYDPILTLVFFTTRTYPKQVRDFLDEIFHHVLDRMRSKEPCKSNTSEEEKVTIKQVQSFFKLIGGILDVDPLIFFSQNNIGHYYILLEFMIVHFDHNIDKSTRKNIVQIWKEMFLQFLDMKPKKVKVQSMLFRSNSSGSNLSDSSEGEVPQTLIAQKFPEQTAALAKILISKSIQYVFSTGINFRNLEDLAMFRLFVEIQAIVRQSPFYEEMVRQFKEAQVPEDKIQLILQHCERFNSKNLNQKGFHDWYIAFVKDIHNQQPQNQ